MGAIFLFLLSALISVQIALNLAYAKTPRRHISPHHRSLKEFGDGNTQKFHNTGCSFYCFFTPKKDELIDLKAIYKSLVCSHLVYGWANVEDERLQTPSTNDLIPYKYYGNFKRIISLRDPPLSMKVLLGMRQAEGTHFLNDAEMSRNVSNRMVYFTRRYGFDGMFLKFNDRELLSPGFERFVDHLDAALDKDAERYKKLRRLSLVLSISAEWAPHVYRRMPKLNTHFSAFYLWSNETKLANADPPRKTPALDALLPSANVERAETISENAEKLAASGVSRRKIIIGLSAFAQKYTLDKDRKPASGAESVPYQELCKISGFTPALLNVDKNASAISYADGNGHWYALNQPDNPAMVEKVKWISTSEFGGVGVYSLQADDLENVCGRGALPLHRSIARQFECVPPVDMNRGNAQGRGCTRMCQVDLGRTSAFTFDALKPDWCSHVIISSVEILWQTLQPTEGFKRAVQQFNNWTAEHKPFLILSIGAPEQGSEVWRPNVMNALRRLDFTNNVRKLVFETKANGIEINWTHGRMGLMDKFSFTSLAKELRETLPADRQIIVSLAPENLYKHDYDNPYDFGTLVNSVDFFVAHGFAFHRPSNAHTGHHSPMFSNHELLTDPRMTIEGMTSDLLGQKVPAEKIIVGLSAQAMSMTFGIDNMRVSDRNIGDLATSHSSASAYTAPSANNRIGIRPRALGAGAVTQTEVCRILAKNASVVEERFIEPLAAPYLINDREFIAYDNVRSIQIKTVWVSMHNFGGIALYNLEADDITGECPTGKPFRLLSTIAEAQMCNLCNSTASASGNGTITPEAEEAEPTTKMSPGDTSKDAGVCAKAANKFLVSCSYRLPKPNAENYLTPEELPYGQCDEIVVEEAVLNGTEVDEKYLSLTGGEMAAQTIANLTHLASHAGVKSVVAAIGCSANVRGKFAELISKGKRSQLVAEIRAFVNAHNFTGVQFKQCNHLVTDATRDDFAGLLIDLRTAFLDDDAEKAEGESCVKTISLRIPVWHTNLTANYNLDVLNSLQHVVLESSHYTTGNQTLLLNPLYGDGLDKDAELHVQDSTLHAWFASGLHPNRVIMQIPAYGIRQVINDTSTAESAKPGDAIKRQRIQIISQTEVCEQLRETGCVSHTMFDLLSGYAVSKHQWVSYESKHTVGYKMKYAVKQRLGGVSLHTLNDDDTEGGCRGGEYPLLGEILEARCQRQNAKATSTGEKTA